MILPPSLGRALLALSTALLMWTCQRDAQASVTAEFGVFYGGQLQRRREVPFTLNRTRQSQGFRLSFTRPLNTEARLAWELSVPEGSRESTPTTPKARTTRLGEELLRPGTARFEKRLDFEPGDGLGLYNIRVTLNNRLLLDRAFQVFNPDRRRRARQKYERSSADAGF